VHNVGKKYHEFDFEGIYEIIIPEEKRLLGLAFNHKMEKEK